MPRSRQSAKQAGRSFETLIATYLAKELESDYIERRRLTGANDRGDITGVRDSRGQRLVLELKNYGGQLKPGTWVEEAHTEMGNDDAVAGVVVAKRRGTTNPGAQFVLMTVNDLVALIRGDRPDNDL
ncbi:hypothetical protein I6J24_06905 [Corynebacterium kroppenstedtii]|uniref:hypothetical protein n=1 Tax=Corynebacterium pseudokroppenstedtii TaxID=2804917 RepID=UPI00194F0245|nr:hypothetical protein [Corynebacterium pseudokroppenstedtii]MDK7147213.1 hypothetical protein [Corynebacterium pseudokroppenstedtii]QRP13847.1 hypothetical protein I6J24_06905 [Corynebacterium kroppenstedtii]